MRKLTLTEAQAKEIAAHAGRCMTAVNQIMHAGCGITKWTARKPLPLGMGRKRRLLDPGNSM
jgi:hypothetical protein